MFKLHYSYSIDS